MALLLVAALGRGQAALASTKQDNVRFHSALMQATEPVTEETVIETAGTVGLDALQLRADMRDPAIVPSAVDRGMLQRLIERLR